MSPSMLTEIRTALVEYRSARWLAFALVNTIVVLVGGSLLMHSLFRASAETNEVSVPIAPYDSLVVVMANLPGGVQDWEAHSEALDAIEEATGKTVLLRYLTLGDSAVDAVLTSDVDIAFLSLRGFLLFMDSGNGDYFALCRPMIGGRDRDSGVFVVNSSSGYRTLEDLRGADIALGPTERPGGYGYANWLMAERGTTIEEFFGRVETCSLPRDDLLALTHNRINVVATTRSQLDFWPSSRFRVIVESPDYATPAVLVSKHVPPRVRDQIRETLESLQHGTGLCESSGIDGFVSGGTADYSIAQLFLPYTLPSEIDIPEWDGVQ